MNIPMHRLYVADRAPNPRRVLLFLAAKGLVATDIGLEVIPVNLAENANRTPEYLKLNPLGLTPALELADGQVITESVAICRYIEGLYPEPALFGHELIEQVKINQYSRQAELEVLVPLINAFRNEHAYWIGRFEQVPAVAPADRRRVQARLSYFDQRLQVVTYLAGDRLSIADLTLYAALDFGRLAGLVVDELHPALLAFYKRLHEQFCHIR